MTSTKKSIGINFVTQYLELSIQFISVLVLARLLTPADTGVFSVAAFLMVLLHMFRDFGVVNYVIQEVDLTREKIQSAFGVAIILALLVAGIMLLASGVVARFYGNPALKSILQVMALSFAVSPFGSLLFGLYRREMKFETIFFIKIASAICHVTVAVTLAYRGFGALSMAWANFAGIMSFGVVANLYRPKNLPFLPKFSHIGKILSFGGISSVGNAANAIGTNIPDLVIAKTIDMAAVGYFSRGNGLVQLFAKLISSALTPIILPYFSQIKRDGADLKQAYLVAVNYLTILAWPFFAVMAVMALQIVNVLYGPQWNSSVPIVKMLCLAGAITAVTIFATHVMIANGQVRQATYAQMLSQPLKVLAIILASGYGLSGISLAIIFGEFVTLLIIYRYLKTTIGVTLAELVTTCWHSTIVTACSVVGPLFVTLVWSTTPGNQLSQLLLATLSATVGWLVGIAVTKHLLYGHLVQFIKAGDFPAPASFHGPWRFIHSLKYCCKFLLYQTGIMAVFHRLRNRDVLTVAMFHRVLPTDQIALLGADPIWSMSTSTFKQCLQFFAKNYRVITVDQLAKSLQKRERLPANSLLITFDDGWADTAQFAQPILDQFHMNSVVFVAGSVIGQAAPFWQEVLYSLLSKNPSGILTLNAALAEVQIALEFSNHPIKSNADIRALIRHLEQQQAEKLHQLALKLHEASGLGALMLSQEQLRSLAATQTIGSHGYSHQPLTNMSDPGKEVRTAQQCLSACLQGLPINAMSFPHGRYNTQIVDACRAENVQLLFSSDQILNQTKQHNPEELIFGRIAISEQDITDTAGRFHPFMLAFLLFLRPIASLRP